MEKKPRTIKEKRLLGRDACIISEFMSLMQVKAKGNETSVSMTMFNGENYEILRNLLVSGYENLTTDDVDTMTYGELQTFAYNLTNQGSKSDSEKNFILTVNKSSKKN